MEVAVGGRKPIRIWLAGWACVLVSSGFVVDSVGCLRLDPLLAQLTPGLLLMEGSSGSTLRRSRWWY